MVFELINERVINKKKSIFNKVVVCLLKINNLKIIESYSIMDMGDKNE
jgi:hypothetical protein